MQKNSRELLIDAAKKSLILNGSNQTSIKQIARIAGVNHGLVHHYFSSKEDLFIAVLCENNGAFCESIKKLNKNSDLEVVLSEYIQPNLRLIIEMINLSGNMPELNTQLIRRIDITKSILGEHFNIADYKKQSILISSMLGLVIHNKINKNFSINEHLIDLVDSLKA